jgi:hypothetical protein
MKFDRVFTGQIFIAAICRTHRSTGTEHTEIGIRTNIAFDFIMVSDLLTLVVRKAPLTPRLKFQGEEF